MQIALLSLPFGDHVDSLTQEQWLRRLQDDGFRPYMPQHTPQGLRKALQRAWRSDASQRCSSRELVASLQVLLDEEEGRGGE